MKDLSIITVVFNAQFTVKNSIESINKQIYPKFLFDHHIIDGLSTDGTLEIVKSTMGSNAILLSEKDNGIYDALNKGIINSTGSIIGILHSDDTYEDEYVISDVMDIFKDPKVNLVYGDLVYVNKNNPSKIIRKWIAGNYSYKKLKYGWMPPHPTLFIRRSFVENLGTFNTKYKISADYDLILRYFKSSDLNFCYIPRILVKMNIGGESNKSFSNLVKKTAEDFHIVKTNKVGGILTIFYKNFIKIKQFL